MIDLNRINAIIDPLIEQNVLPEDCNAELKALERGTKTRVTIVTPEPISFLRSFFDDLHEEQINAAMNQNPVHITQIDNFAAQPDDTENWVLLPEQKILENRFFSLVRDEGFYPPEVLRCIATADLVLVCVTGRLTTASISKIKFGMELTHVAGSGPESRTAALHMFPESMPPEEIDAIAAANAQTLAEDKDAIDAYLLENVDDLEAVISGFEAERQHTQTIVAANDLLTLTTSCRQNLESDRQFIEINFRRREAAETIITDQEQWDSEFADYSSGVGATIDNHIREGGTHIKEAFKGHNGGEVKTHLIRALRGMKCNPRNKADVQGHADSS